MALFFRHFLVKMFIPNKIVALFLPKFTPFLTRPPPWGWKPRLAMWPLPSAVMVDNSSNALACSGPKVYTDQAYHIRTR